MSHQPDLLVQQNDALEMQPFPCILCPHRSEEGLVRYSTVKIRKSGSKHLVDARPKAHKVSDSWGDRRFSG
jgi:hypothetical protein